MNYFLLVVKVIVLFLPWKLKRYILVRFFKYEIHSTAKIGLAWIFPVRLKLSEGCRIGFFTVCKGLSFLSMGENSSIGRGNWISAFPITNNKHFSHQPDRNPILIVGCHSAITNRHIIDCTNKIEIGSYSTFAGYASQILTHSIDLKESRQSSKEVYIGNYCFVGTNSVILGGSYLPNYSVLGANSLLNKKFSEEYSLYAGVAATKIKNLDSSCKYFIRKSGFVY